MVVHSQAKLLTGLQQYPYLPVYNVSDIQIATLSMRVKPGVTDGVEAAVKVVVAGMYYPKCIATQPIFTCTRMLRYMTLMPPTSSLSFLLTQHS